MKGLLGNQKVRIRKFNIYLIGILGGKIGEDEEFIFKEITVEKFFELKKEVSCQIYGLL